MTIDLFNFKDSRSYLLSVLGDKSQRRGMKSAAARYVGCHMTTISQLLHGKIVLNLEQADRFSRFLNHSEDERHYFFLLVQKDRAGNRSLQSYFQCQLEQFIAGRLVIKKRMGVTESVSKEDEQKYYSSWLYAAIHVALSIPELRTPEALSRHFQVALANANDALAFLLASGLAALGKEGYVIGPKHIHLGTGSSQLANHHRNWRLKAIQSFEGGSKTNLHYSAAVTLSHEDSILVREKLIEYIKELNKTIQVSKEEDAYAMNFDFFKL